MEHDETLDVNERIAEHVRKAHQIARWLRLCEVVYAVLCLIGAAWMATEIGPLLGTIFERGGWEAVLGLCSSFLRNAVFFLFLLLLAETARRIVLVVARLAEEVKGTV